MNKLQVTILFLFAFCFLLFATSARADTISLAVDPPIFQINATPPANILSPITVENRGDSPINLKVEFEPFVPSESANGQVKYVKGKVDGVSLQDQSGQDVAQFTLDPKEKRSFNLAINIPKDYPQNDYYFSVIFLSSATGTNTSSSQSVSGIASNVLLSVGQGKVSGEIEQFSAPLFLEKGPVPFTVRVKNTSNHFITPKGEILIKNLFGQTIGRVDLGQVNILTDSERIIPSSDFSGLKAYWPEKFILGPYKATLSITLSDTGPLFRRSIIFFAFPAQTGIIILITLIVLIYIILKVRPKV